MSKLFESTTINNMPLANRFVRSATWLGMAKDDGSVSPKLIDVLVKLAQGGVGLIITGFHYVSREGQSVPWQLGIYSDEFLPGLTEMAEAVHKAGGTIVMQLVHAGLQALPAVAQMNGLEILGPSVMETKEGPVGREMTQDEIRETVRAFGQAAARAQKAGFDGVQIHGAHGYLLNEFLSPFFNMRKDEYGGSIENRARIVLEVVQSVRAAVGDQFPVLIKINSEDFLEGGFSVEDMLPVAAMLQKAGVDAIELSGGTSLALHAGNPNASPMRTEKKEVWYREAAKRYKEKISLPLMLVGGIRSYEVAERLVDGGITDYISLARPLIREPDLINRWKAGDIRKADCISDNACAGAVVEGKGAHCVHLGSQ